MGRMAVALLLLGAVVLGLFGGAWLIHAPLTGETATSTHTAEPRPPR